MTTSVLWCYKFFYLNLQRSEKHQLILGNMEIVIFDCFTQTPFPNCIYTLTSTRAPPSWLSWTPEFEVNSDDGSKTIWVQENYSSQLLALLNSLGCTHLRASTCGFLISWFPRQPFWNQFCHFWNHLWSILGPFTIIFVFVSKQVRVFEYLISE